MHQDSPQQSKGMRHSTHTDRNWLISKLLRWVEKARCKKDSVIAFKTEIRVAAPWRRAEDKGGGQHCGKRERRKLPVGRNYCGLKCVPPPNSYVGPLTLDQTVFEDKVKWDPKRRGLIKRDWWPQGKPACVLCLRITEAGFGHRWNELAWQPGPRLGEGWEAWRGPHGRAFALEVASTPSPVTRHTSQVVMSVYVWGGTGKKVGTLFSCGGKPELQVFFFFFNCKKPTS